MKEPYNPNYIKELLYMGNKEISLVSVTPYAYKDGKLFTIMNIDTSGEFIFFNREIPDGKTVIETANFISKDILGLIYNNEDLIHYNIHSAKSCFKIEVTFEELEYISNKYQPLENSLGRVIVPMFKDNEFKFNIYKQNINEVTREYLKFLQKVQ